MRAASARPRAQGTCSGRGGPQQRSALSSGLSAEAVDEYTREDVDECQDSGRLSAQAADEFSTEVGARIRQDVCRRQDTGLKTQSHARTHAHKRARARAHAPALCERRTLAVSWRRRRPRRRRRAAATRRAPPVSPAGHTRCVNSFSCPYMCQELLVSVYLLVSISISIASRVRRISFGFSRPVVPLQRHLLPANYNWP